MEPVVNALPKVHPPPTPLKIKVTFDNAIPLVVSVFPVEVDEKRIAPPAVPLKTKLVAGIVIEP